MKNIAFISILLFSNCFGSDYVIDYRSNLSRNIYEAPSQYEKLNELEKKIVIARRDVFNFLKTCRRFDLLDQLDNPDSRPIMMAMKELAVPTDEILKVYKKQWKPCGDLKKTQRSPFFNYERAALFYAASHGLLDETQLTLKEDPNFFEKDKSGKYLLDKVLSVVKGILRHLTALDFSAIASSPMYNPSRYDTFCRDGKLLAGYLQYVHKLKNEVHASITITDPIESLVVSYAMNDKGYVEPVNEDYCVIL